MDLPWWKRSVIYHIYPRSFADASGDGIGDLAGIHQHLDHVTWLGVDGLSIAPIFPSPMVDFGYDVANFNDVDPVFGTLDDFDELLTSAHRRGLRLLLDWVPDHTSDRHPWFMASRGSRGNPYRDWYWWRDQPNKWRRAWGDAPAWTLDPRTGQYYLHQFLPQQPELNWDNPAVRNAMHDTLRFWLDRGVDGFSADVVHLIGTDPALPDGPGAHHHLSRAGFHTDPRTSGWLREIRAVLDGCGGDRVMVGRINLADPTAAASYAGPDELHLALQFSLLQAAWDAAAFGDVIANVEAATAASGTWPAWLLSDHDTSRHRSRYRGSEARARVAALVLLTLRGTPVLYAGEELGLEDAVVAPELAVDPGLRDPCRAPVPWHGRAGHGWAGDTPWLPWPPDADTRNAAAQRRDPASVAGLYQRLLQLRRSDEILQAGDLELRDVHAGVLAYDRVSAGCRRRVLANFADQPVTVDRGGWTVLVATRHDRDNERFDGRLDPTEAVVLQPVG
jgi:alpha-glucosidase